MTLLYIALSVLFGLGAGYGLRTFLGKKHRREAEVRSATLVKEAKERARVIELEAKEKAQARVDEALQEESQRRQELSKLEARIEEKLEKLEQRSDDFEEKRQQIEQEKDRLEQQKTQLIEEKATLASQKEQHSKRLEEIAAMSKEQAREQLVASVEDDMRDVLADRMRRRVQAARETADAQARLVASVAIERYAASQASETTATSVHLPSEDLKGRIIGKEGRNIKHLEELTGCELIIDETPNSILISSFNPIRRHVCKQVLEKLLKDGRIHPGRIEEVVESVKKNIAQDIKEAGESVVQELNLHDVHPKLVHLIGRLKFRSSYGQNVLQHSVEMAHIARMLA